MDPMLADTDMTGIIILGNAGTGKSFICNIILGENKFTSAFRATSVTTSTQSARLVYGSESLLVFDIPGLVEAKQVNVNRNKEQIENAFTQCPKSRIIFIFSVTGGRVAHEDIIAFEALHGAYRFKSESLLFLVNTTMNEWEEAYEENILLLLSQLLGSFQFTSKNVLFLPKIHRDDEEKKKQIHDKILDCLMKKSIQSFAERTPIMLAVEEVEHLKEEIRKREKQFETRRSNLKRQLTDAVQQLRAIKNNDSKATVEAGYKCTGSVPDTVDRLRSRENLPNLLCRIEEAHDKYETTIMRAVQELRGTDEQSALTLEDEMKHAKNNYDYERREIKMELEKLNKSWPDVFPCSIF